MNRSGVPAFGGAWSSLNPPLSPWIMEVINKMGFVNMTPVQAGTIPRAIKNQDCVVEAVTGSGKTLAFVIPVLERMTRRAKERKYKKGEIAAVVIAPTRELAAQIHDVFNHFLSSLIPTPPDTEVDPNEPTASSSRSISPPPVTAASEEALFPLPLLVTSGTTTPYETFNSQRSTIIIGTPGRLSSFLLSPRGLNMIKVSEFDMLILDEADRLLSSPDHRRDVERIMRHLPKQRRTHLFSATMTDAVEELIGLGLRNPVRIVVNLKDKRNGQELQERRTPTGLNNTFLVCRHAEKTLQLIRLLQAETSKNEAAKYIIYFSTCAAVDYFYRILSRIPSLSSYHLTSLHGDLPPKVRETALTTFTSHPSSHLSPAVLLCTDVAARGVDFTDIDVVIQYDPPTDPKTFSHRAGRTARAGRKGKGVVLLAKGREEDYVDFLAVRKIPLRQEAYLDASLEPSASPPTLDPKALELLSQLRKIILTDRELADKGAKAFVSSLRAYSKHEASFIFRVQDLDFYSLGVGYGLLRLPAMPEIKDWKKRKEMERKRRALKAEQAAAVPSNGAEVKAEVQIDDVEAEEEISWQDADVDWDAFAYASKSREAARLLTLSTKTSTPTLTEEQLSMKGTKRKIKAEMKESWSEQKDKKVKKEERREKRDKFKQAEWERTQGEGEKGMVEKALEGVERKKKDNKDKVDVEEVMEMGVEYKALKKEMKAEKVGNKSKRKNEGGGMFDDLE